MQIHTEVGDAHLTHLLHTHYHLAPRTHTQHLLRTTYLRTQRAYPPSTTLRATPPLRTDGRGGGDLPPPLPTYHTTPHATPAHLASQRTTPRLPHHLRYT